MGQIFSCCCREQESEAPEVPSNTSSVVSNTMSNDQKVLVVVKEEEKISMGIEIQEVQAAQASQAQSNVFGEPGSGSSVRDLIARFEALSRANGENLGELRVQRNQ